MSLPTKAYTDNTKTTMHFIFIFLVLKMTRFQEYKISLEDKNT